MRVIYALLTPLMHHIHSANMTNTCHAHAANNVYACHICAANTANMCHDTCILQIFFLLRAICAANIANTYV